SCTYLIITAYFFKSFLHYLFNSCHTKEIPRCARDDVGSYVFFLKSKEKFFMTVTFPKHHPWNRCGSLLNFVYFVTLV
ncbi:MAG: hypothetical protein NTW08_03480, partial [Gammaproteobacteria bacterium]|nr:hypothetical protein [Gammaproteobacteria bacterium]